MDVLKDASATAIYGSRGSNGVIIITTKKGQEGPAKLDFNYSIGASNALKKLEVLSPEEFRQTIKDYNFSGGDEKGSADGLNSILRTALTQNFNVGVSAADRKTPATAPPSAS